MLVQFTAKLHFKDEKLALRKIFDMASHKIAPDAVNLANLSLLERLDYITGTTISLLDVIDRALPQGDNTETSWQCFKRAKLDTLYTQIQYLESVKVNLNQACLGKLNDELGIGPWRPSRRTIGTIV